MAEVEKRPSADYSVIGSTGLARYGGYVFDEWLPELQGVKGRRVLREMQDNDPIVGACLFTVEMLARQVLFRVVPGDETDKAESDAEFIEQARHDMSQPWTDVISEIMSFLPYGWGLHETCFKLRDGKTSKYDDGKIGWRSWPIRGQETLLRWDFDDFGQPSAMVQLGPPDWIEHTIPLSKAMLFRTTAKRGNPEGRSVLRNAYRPWYFKKHIENIEAIGMERDLAGMPVMYVPDQLLAPDASPELQAQLAEYVQMVRRVRRDEQEGIILPGSFYPNTTERKYHFELLTSGGSRQFDTDTVIARKSEEIAMSVMADFIMMGHGSVGSHSLGDSKARMFAAALTSWLDTICDVVNEQGIVPLLRLNGLLDDTPPRLEHGNVERSDLDVLGAFLANLSLAGIPLDRRPDGELLRHLMAEAGLPEPPSAEAMLEFMDPNGVQPADQGGAPNQNPASNPTNPPNNVPKSGAGQKSSRLNRNTDGSKAKPVKNGSSGSKRGSSPKQGGFKGPKG